MSSFRNLTLHQIQQRLFKIKKGGIDIPKKGWIKTIRQCYGMTTKELGKRLGLSQSRISMAEKAEIHHNLTLESLQRFANALNCELFYAFVPKEPMEDFLKRKAQEKATEQITVLTQTMQLESQGISSKERHRLYEELVQEYLKNPSKIWPE